jgi:4-alpha-glucanotransferase
MLTAMILSKRGGYRMKFERAAGILLHPTSLPGPYGIGDLGPEAYRWIDFLVETGCKLWQVLPLGPTGYGDSPYQCFSAFAGNPYLISPDLLLDDGLLEPGELENLPPFPAHKVDYGEIIPWKLDLLDRAYQKFRQSKAVQLNAEFQQFITDNEDWLTDYALFMALKDVHGGQPWPSWEKPLRDRDADALQSARIEHAELVQRHIFRQFIFFRQWISLKLYANENGIKIIGDIPIFVAHDSAEVWAKPGLFFIDKHGNPTVVAGVPPDYFSPTGQLWGNPLYRWDVHAKNNYLWWINRFSAVLKLVDIVRLDHFRGFAGYWEVPADEETAENGRWVPGPGKKFLNALKESLGDLPIIAEDLGEITPDVVEMREHFNLPGMKILVFAFSDDPENDFLPHNYVSNCVVYTGTHDNDTVVGWYHRVRAEETHFARRYLGRDGKDIAWDLIRTGWSSVAVFAIAQMQDMLGLDNHARMNYPSRPSGNWMWRMDVDAIDEHIKTRLTEFNYLYRRGVPPEKEEELEGDDLVQEQDMHQENAGT